MTAPWPFCLWSEKFFSTPPFCQVDITTPHLIENQEASIFAIVASYLDF